MCVSVKTRVFKINIERRGWRRRGDLRGRFSFAQGAAAGSHGGGRDWLATIYFAAGRGRISLMVDNDTIAVIIIVVSIIVIGIVAVIVTYSVGICFGNRIGEDTEGDIIRQAHPHNLPEGRVCLSQRR